LWVCPLFGGGDSISGTSKRRRFYVVVAAYPSLLAKLKLGRLYAQAADML